MRVLDDFVSCQPLSDVLRPHVQLDHPQLTTTVPKEYVHRAAISEVLLTGCTAYDEKTYVVRAQWPRGHCLFAPVAGRWQDPLLVAESMRQTGLLIAHTGFGVPLGHCFLIRDLSFTTMNPIPISEKPTEFDLVVTCRDIRKRGTRLLGMECDITLLRDGETAAHGKASFNCLPPAVYRKVRGDRPARISSARPTQLVAPERPGYLGRSTPDAVVLGQRLPSGRWRLRVDPSHPSLFDHPLDHVPGMLLMEAARQAARCVSYPTNRLVTAMNCVFERFVELNEPCWVEAERLPDQHDDWRVQVTASQGDTTVFRSEVRLTDLDTVPLSNVMRATPLVTAGAS